MKTESVAAIVVHYESPSTLENTLASLALHIDKNKIVVVDNSSTLERSQIDADITILDDGTNRGYAGGVNRGFRHVQEYMPEVTEILVCTHEAIFRSGSVAGLMNTAALHPDGHVVGPKLVSQNAEGNEVVWSNGGKLALPFYYPTHNTRPGASGTKRADWIDGAAFLIDAKSLARLGGIPEEFFMYMEDVALGVKCASAGIPVVVNLDTEVEQTANGPKRSLAIRNRTLLALRYFNFWKRMIVLIEVSARQLLMSAYPSQNFRAKAVESRKAILEARRIAASLPPIGSGQATTGKL
ncbi:glycosyltransferase family 2 protein [Arthrobacter sp. M4]|uniref:glycosyltransferase family 2 protein n=1 Tax=Arthrobacter sp. M4 TaxID=218160 RepID=UPI001CDD1FD9|nr:glycosyltransferase family 2 protein [Arthrobacter sp. M4]MCA4133061.1 glycosyltransferase family 2 protein [Arthrobacter sp. M4]